MTGPELRQWRQRMGFSQQEVARALGITQVTVSRWERGVTPVEHPEMLGLAITGWMAQWRATIDASLREQGLVPLAQAPTTEEVR